MQQNQTQILWYPNGYPFDDRNVNDRHRATLAEPNPPDYDFSVSQGSVGFTHALDGIDIAPFTSRKFAHRIASVIFC